MYCHLSVWRWILLELSLRNPQLYALLLSPKRGEDVAYHNGLLSISWWTVVCVYIFRQVGSRLGINVVWFHNTLQIILGWFTIFKLYIATTGTGGEYTIIWMFDVFDSKCSSSLLYSDISSIKLYFQQLIYIYLT